jgi:putative membrane protein
MKRMIQGFLLAGALVLGGAALAQGTTPGAGQGSPQGQTMRDTQARAGKPTVKGGMIEHMGVTVPADEKAFLERLHHINQLEIQLGNLAQQNAQSQDVKSYGEMLVRDHTTADQQLMSYARQRGHKLADTPKPLNEVERKSMDAHRAAMEKLRVLKGQPFDADFLAHMVGDHDMALGKVMAGQQHFTDAAISPVLQQHAQVIARHRQQAHTLLGRIGPGATMGVGGAGDMGKGHMDHDMGSGTGGTGDVNRGQSPSDRNTMDPGNQKKY